MAEPLSARVARLEVTTETINTRTEKLETKMDSALTKLDKIHLNGQTEVLKRLAQKELVDGLVIVAQAAPDIQEMVNRHRDKKGFTRTLSRMTAWRFSSQVIILALGGALGVAAPHLIPIILGLL